MPAVYVIGGSTLGARVLEWARECGLERIVTDRDPDSPGLREAEAGRVIDGADERAHLEYVSELRSRHRIVGVYCGAEFGVRTVNRLSRELGLPALDPAAVAVALDKPALKRALAGAGIPTPPSYTVRDEGALRGVVRRGGEWVIKPAGGSGSRGVVVVGSEDECGRALDSSRHAMPGEREWVVEPFRRARSIDANGCFLDGRFHPCGVLEKFATPLPDCLPIGGYDPALITPEETGEVYRLLEEACRAVGLTVGPVKGDLLLGEDRLEVLEVAPRFHGDVTTSNTLPFGSDQNPVRFLFRHFASGECATEEIAGEHPAYATWRVIAAPPGRILRAGAPPEHYPEGPGLTRIWFNPRLVDSIPRYASTVTIPGYACAWGRDRAEAEAALGRWSAGNELVVEADERHAAWYRHLGERLSEVGFAPDCSGWRGLRSAG